MLTQPSLGNQIKHAQAAIICHLIPNARKLKGQWGIKTFY